MSEFAEFLASLVDPVNPKAMEQWAKWSPFLAHTRTKTQLKMASTILIFLQLLPFAKEGCEQPLLNAIYDGWVNTRYCDYFYQKGNNMYVVQAMKNAKNEFFEYLQVVPIPSYAFDEKYCDLPQFLAKFDRAKLDTSTEVLYGTMVQFRERIVKGSTAWNALMVVVEKFEV